MSEYVGLKQGKVHEEHIVSEYYCGGCGWPVTDHDSYCTECGGELHKGMSANRWHELFGTPERAAQMLAEFELDHLNWCRGTDYCEKCPYEFDRYGCCLPDGFSLLEWLRGDAR